jgi:hypothetical protein
MEEHLLRPRRSDADVQNCNHQCTNVDARRRWVDQVAVAINSAGRAIAPDPDARAMPLSMPLYVEVIRGTIRLTTDGGIQILIGMTRGFEVVHASAAADAQFAITVSDWTQALALILTLIDLTGCVLHRAAHVSR